MRSLTTVRTTSNSFGFTQGRIALVGKRGLKAMARLLKSWRSGCAIQPCSLALLRPWSPAFAVAVPARERVSSGAIGRYTYRHSTRPGHGVSGV
jgi:hypothetical protein